MVRPELLRAKSLHAEVTYLRDLKQVGDAKVAADQHSRKLVEKEQHFWAEALKARIPASNAVVENLPATVNLQSPTQFTAQLERMHRAHSQLKHSHRSHKTAVTHLNETLTTLSGSQKRVEIVEAFVAKARRIRSNRFESRLSEDVAELVTTCRSILALRASAAPLNLQNSQKLLTQPLGALPQSDHPNKFEISQVALSIDHGQPKLSLSCAIAGRGAVNLQVTKAETGGVSVLIDPSVVGVALGVLKDRRSIQLRLQALGINVSMIEVGASGDSPGVHKRAKSSQRQEEEEEDEGIIS